VLFAPGPGVAAEFRVRPLLLQHTPQLPEAAHLEHVSWFRHVIGSGVMYSRWRVIRSVHEGQKRAATMLGHPGPMPWPGR